MDIGGDLPAEGLIQQVIFGGRGQVLGPPYHVGDAHEMVVHHVGEIIGGQAVGLEEDLVVQLGVVHGDVPVHRVVEGGGALGNTLTDDIGLSSGHPGLRLIQG